MSDIASFPEYVAQYNNSRQFLTLGAANGLVDQTGLGRDGTAVGGVVVGGAVGPGDLGATQFDGVDDAITTSYNPFSNVETKTFFGWGYRDNNTNNAALFGGDAAGARPQLRTSAGGNTVAYFPDSSLGSTAWTGAWLGGVGGWIFWMLRHDAVAATANLWIGTPNSPPTDQGLKTGLTAFPASPGNIVYGRASTALFPWVGRQAFVGLVRGDATPDAKTFWSWGLSTTASRAPLTGLPSTSTFPFPAHLPRGETL